MRTLNPRDQRARLYLVRDSQIDAIDGVITRLEGQEAIVRIAGLEGYTVGASCVLVVRSREGTFRCRARLSQIGDIAVRVRLLDEMRRADRRIYPRAEVRVRALARPLDAPSPIEAASPTARLSLVPREIGWHPSVASLSPSGIRLELPGAWQVGALAELRLQVPESAPEHLVLRGVVLRTDPAGAAGRPGWVVLRFVEVDAQTQRHLIDVVDRSCPLGAFHTS